MSTQIYYPTVIIWWEYVLGGAVPSLHCTYLRLAMVAFSQNLRCNPDCQMCDDRLYMTLSCEGCTAVSHNAGEERSLVDVALLKLEAHRQHPLPRPPQGRRSFCGCRCSQCGAVMELNTTKYNIIIGVKYLLLYFQLVWYNELGWENK